MQPVDQSDCDFAMYAKFCKVPREGDVLLTLPIHQPIRRRFFNALVDLYFEIILRGRKRSKLCRFSLKQMKLLYRVTHQVGKNLLLTLI